MDDSLRLKSSSTPSTSPPARKSTDAVLRTAGKAILEGTQERMTILAVEFFYVSLHEDNSHALLLDLSGLLKMYGDAPVLQKPEALQKVVVFCQTALEILPAENTNLGKMVLKTVGSAARQFLPKITEAAKQVDTRSNQPVGHASGKLENKSTHELVSPTQPTDRKDEVFAFGMRSPEEEEATRSRLLAGLDAFDDARAKAQASRPSAQPASLGDRLAFAKTFGRLEGNCWMEFIDKKLHSLGARAIDEGLGPEQLKEPKYSASMLEARKCAAKFLGEPLSLPMYQTLYRLASAHHGSNSRYRNEGDIISLGSETMSQQAIKEVAKAGPPMVNRVKIEDRSKGFLLHMVPTTSSTMQMAVGALLDEYNHAIAEAKNATGRLCVIADLIQDLERLHPFLNANGRTNMLLMNKLLTENGFHPAVVEDPNAAPFLTRDEWRKEVLRGLDNWKKLGPPTQ